MELSIGGVTTTIEETRNNPFRSYHLCAAVPPYKRNHHWYTGIHHLFTCGFCLVSVDRSQHNRRQWL